MCLKDTTQNTNMCTCAHTHRRTSSETHWWLLFICDRNGTSFQEFRELDSIRFHRKACLCHSSLQKVLFDESDQRCFSLQNLYRKPPRDIERFSSEIRPAGEDNLRICTIFAAIERRRFLLGEKLVIVEAFFF